jgi:transposase
MGFVPTSKEEQPDMQALHRVREQLVKKRTALDNQIRGLLRECGIVVAQAIARLLAALPVILENQSNRLSSLMRELLGELAERLRMLDDRRRLYDQRIARICQQDERCRRLIKGEGVGPLVATALVGVIGSARQFTNGRLAKRLAWAGAARALQGPPHDVARH